MSDHPNQHFTPFESQEFEDWEYWRTQATQGELKTVRAIAAWSDICGFGNALNAAEWNLSKVRDSGLFRALSQAYVLLGRALIAGVPPMPSERVLVINDGVARTIDLTEAKFIHHGQLLFYVRDLLMHHYMLEDDLVNSGLGLRTVLAGGERCQYSPQKSTGHSMLSYTNQPSNFGKKLLEQQFVYNPAEFQMNTAFALAYTLEAMGSKNGLTPNRVYIEQNWLNSLNNVIPRFCIVEGESIHCMWNDAPGISISFDDCRSVEIKGITTNVYRVNEFVVHKCFEGERTAFPMAAHDRQTMPNPSINTDWPQKTRPADYVQR